MSVMISDRYSLTLGSNSMAAECSPAACCMPIENCITTGMAMKNTTLAPTRNSTGVAIR